MSGWQTTSAVGIFGCWKRTRSHRNYRCINVSKSSLSSRLNSGVPPVLNGHKIFVVMPAYTAARTLAYTFRELPHEIVDAVLLVDDGSSDATVELARDIGLTTFTY